MIIEVRQTTTYKLDTDEYEFDNGEPTPKDLAELLQAIADGDEDCPDDEATITITHSRIH